LSYLEAKSMNYGYWRFQFSIILNYKLRQLVGNNSNKGGNSKTVRGSKANKPLTELDPKRILIKIKYG
jgi:hypothetical protein